MRIINFDDLIGMDGNEIVSVSKNAIHIQIVKYESKQYYNCQKTKELGILTRILSELLENEQKNDRQIQCAQMKVEEIRICFTKENFPRSTFVQYE